MIKEAPQPKPRPAGLTSDEVKRERNRARNATARELMEQLNTIIVEDEAAAAEEDLYK